MTPILKFKTHNQERELEFELDYQFSLTADQRFRMMFRRSRELARMLRSHDHRKAPRIIKRS